MVITIKLVVAIVFMLAAVVVGYQGLQAYTLNVSALQHQDSLTDDLQSVLRTEEGLVLKLSVMMDAPDSRRLRETASAANDFIRALNGIAPQIFASMKITETKKAIESLRGTAQSLSDMGKILEDPAKTDQKADIEAQIGNISAVSLNVVDVIRPFLADIIDSGFASISEKRHQTSTDLITTTVLYSGLSLSLALIGLLILGLHIGMASQQQTINKQHESLEEKNRALEHLHADVDSAYERIGKMLTASEDHRLIDFDHIQATCASELIPAMDGLQRLMKRETDGEPMTTLIGNVADTLKTFRGNPEKKTLLSLFSLCDAIAREFPALMDRLQTADADTRLDATEAVNYLKSFISALKTEAENEDSASNQKLKNMRTRPEITELLGQAREGLKPKQNNTEVI